MNFKSLPMSQLQQTVFKEQYVKPDVEIIELCTKGCWMEDLSKNDQSGDDSFWNL